MSGWRLLSSRTALGALGVPLMVLLAVRPMPAEPVHTLRLPGPLAELAEASDIAGNRPAARILDDVIRAIHVLAPGISPRVDARRTQVLTWLDGARSTTPGTRSGLVPSPLPADSWRAALGMIGASEEATSARLLTSRELSLVYYALERATPGLRAFLAARPEVVAALAGTHAGVPAAFPLAVDIVDDRVRLPGGDALVPFWESIVGAPTDDPGAFLVAVHSRSDGRIAFLLDTLARLDEPRRAFALSEGIDDRAARLDDLRVLSEVFVDTHAEWQVAQRPFWRLRIDPLVVLLSLEVDDRGHLAGPQSRQFWRNVIAGKPPPPESTEPGDDEGPVTAGWLLTRVLAGGDPSSQAQLGAVTFTQRLLRRVHGEDVAAVGAAGGMFVRVPVLLQVLERMGIADPRLYVELAAVAVGLADGAVTPDVEVTLTTFQSVVAVVDRAVARRSLGPAEASHLLGELAAIRRLDRAVGRRALSLWVQARFIPALGAGGNSTRSAETILIDALAGVGSRHADAPFTPFELDGTTYRVDLAAPERERLKAVRRRQLSVNLTTALELSRQVDALVAAGSDGQADRAIQDLLETLDRAASPRTSRGGTGPSEECFEKARVSLVDLQRRHARGERLNPRQAVLDATAAADWALADALRGLVYAVSLGDPRDVVTLAPDVSRRHRLFAGPRSGPALTAWTLPEQARDDAQVWFIRGALLGLEAALPTLALRSLSATADPPAMFMYEIARRQVALNVALANPFDITNRQRDQLARALARGSELASGLCTEGRPPVNEGAEGFVWLHVLWACVHDPQSVGRLITPGRLVALGGVSQSASDLDALGTASGALWSPFSLRWPGRASDLASDGRVVDGLFVSAVVAPHVRVATELAKRGLPAVLAPEVLAMFVTDLIREAPVSFEADAYGLAEGAIDLPEERFDRYVAALAAGGTIVPASATESERR